MYVFLPLERGGSGKILQVPRHQSHRSWLGHIHFWNILRVSVRGRYDKGLVAIQSLAVFRLFHQRERYESLRDVVNSGADFDIPHFDECLPGVPLCGVPMVNHTCSLILNLNSLDGAAGVRSAMILAGFEAQEETGTPHPLRQQQLQLPSSSSPVAYRFGANDSAPSPCSFSRQDSMEQADSGLGL